jgi:prepilin-type processing-associated H-X9-DG protein
VVIGIIAVLISILLPTLGKARQQGDAIKCASNLRQIGMAVQIYLNENKGWLHAWRNKLQWHEDPADFKSPIVDSNHDSAYWGVGYAAGGTMTKKAFFCPSTKVVEGYNSATPVDPADACRSYGINCFGGENSGFKDVGRKAIFLGVGDEIALYKRRGLENDPNRYWVGRNLARLKHQTRTLFAQDAFETVTDGNGDTFADWYQWTPPNHPVDLSSEYLRHNGNRYCNVLFVDTHVEALTRDDLKEPRLYTGLW